ncbi:MAG: carboxymuconolactone decarboxylase family protein [Lentisphaerae bacterium]|nr:carboxymuconolactone decarboxylase family protein [Lentisphaerota bacterium]
MASVKMYAKTGDAKAQEIQSAVEKKFGKLPEVFQAMGRSGDFLEAVLKVSEAAGNNLDPKTKELIIIAVSAVNGCTYCLDAHRSAALMQGVTDEEISGAIEVASAISLFNTFNKAIDLNSDLKTPVRK